MLEQNFDYLIYEANNLSSIDLEQLKQTDILQVNSFIEGSIFHANRMSWVGRLSKANNSLDFIRSKREKKALKNNQSNLEAWGLRVEILPFTQDLYKQFADLYLETTAKKIRAIDDSPRGPILGRLLAGLNVFLAAVFKDNQLVAGLSFHHKGDSILVSLGAKMRNNEIRGGYGGFLELALLDYAYEKKVKKIIHGSRSFNPVGLISKSGLFEFKSRYGYIAYPCEDWKSTFILNPQIVMSDLLFVSFIDNKLTYVVLSDLPEQELVKKFANEEAIVKVVSWQDHQNAVQKLLKSLV